ncbi:MAG: hypothetical protein MZU95_09345 [Desulfomicrobium escambiense]|nr:hypothetical protein [Desulfomicrobium escambiense]
MSIARANASSTAACRLLRQRPDDRQGRRRVALCRRPGRHDLGQTLPRAVPSTAPKTAVPKAPPIERKKVDPLVADPISRGGTEFCTARTSTCMTLPRPAPRTIMATAICQ